MKMKRHCNLCDHQKLNIQQGSVCGLTNKKPHFDKMCTKILLNNKLKGELEEIIIDYEHLKQSKSKIYTNSFIRSIIGVFIIFCGYFIWKYTIDYKINFSILYIKYIILVPGIISITGFYFIKYSLTKIDAFKNELSKAIEVKENIDKILKTYKKIYSYTVSFDKEIHGIQEVEIKIKII
jgi:hypothetical protein